MRETRKEKTRELWRLLTDGPVLSGLNTPTATPESIDCAQQVHRWMDAWVKPLVADLVPELKGRA